MPKYENDSEAPKFNARSQRHQPGDLILDHYMPHAADEEEPGQEAMLQPPLF